MSDAIAWGGLVLLSGRAAVDPATGAVRGTTFSEQLQIVLEDVSMVLDEAGSGLDEVLRVECWLTDRRHFPQWNAAYMDTFTNPRPARTTLVVAGLPIEGLLIEIQLSAAIRA
jgi:2-iminobutanoate/2-iminopropanoate deaminase